MLTFQYENTEVTLAFTYGRENVQLSFFPKKMERDTCTAHLIEKDNGVVTAEVQATVYRNPKEKYNQQLAQKYALTKLLQECYSDSTGYAFRAAVWKAYHFPFQAPLPKSSGLVVEKKPVTAMDIALDVLALLDAKKLIPEGGRYCITENLPTEVAEIDSLQEAIRHPKFQCTVCALGSMLMALVDKENKVHTEDEIDSHDFIEEKLSPYFPKSQLIMIEAAFEGRYTGLATMYPTFVNTNRTAHVAAISYGRTISLFPDGKRLRAIMHNILANHGRFWLPEFASIVEKDGKLDLPF